MNFGSAISDGAAKAVRLAVVAETESEVGLEHIEKGQVDLAPRGVVSNVREICQTQSGYGSLQFIVLGQGAFRASAAGLLRRSRHDSASDEAAASRATTADAWAIEHFGRVADTVAAVQSSNAALASVNGTHGLPLSKQSAVVSSRKRSTSFAVGIKQAVAAVTSDTSEPCAAVTTAPPRFQLVLGILCCRASEITVRALATVNPATSACEDPGSVRSRPQVW